jgi:hypothetical protein
VVDWGPPIVGRLLQEPRVCPTRATEGCSTEERRFVIVSLQRTVVGMLGSSEAMNVCRS